MLKRALLAVAPGLACDATVIKTTGDRQSEQGITSVGKDIFVKEIEEALLAGAIDLAVHSLKDLPVRLPDGLLIGAVLPREDVRDVFCSREGRNLNELAAGARVATGSLRREAQLKRVYGHLQFVPIRGNVDTRLRKIREGEADGAVLARAGLVRLGLESAITEILPLEVCLPAPGQGAIGVEARGVDRETLALLERVHHADSGRAVTAERKFLEGLGGGCRTPIAAYALVDKEEIRLHGFVGEAAGGRFVTGTLSGALSDPEALGTRLAEQLLSHGAADLLPARP